MAISSTNSATNTAAVGASTATSSVSATQDRFLTLLVSQLKNQDPLNPMDNAQVTTQMAQLSTVGGIDKLNETMTALAASLGASQYMQSASLVGHEVLVPGQKLQLANGTGTGGFELTSAAEQVTVTINDSSGRAVRKLELGAQEAGMQMFAWDGLTDAGAQVPDGTYTIAVAATSSGKQSNVDSFMVGRVDGVLAGKQGTQAQLGALGRVDVSEIRQIN